MDWTELLSLYKKLYNSARGLAQRIFDQDYRGAKLKVALSINISKSMNSPTSASYILSLSSYEDTTNPKDKVYAVSAFFANGIRRFIVDDSMSVEQVYIETTRATIAHEKSYYVLSQVEGYHRDPRLPWVPKWRVKRLARSLFAVKYQKGCTHNVGPEDLNTTSSFPNELSVTAHKIDRVVAIHALEPFRSNLISATQDGWR